MAASFSAALAPHYLAYAYFLCKYCGKRRHCQQYLHIVLGHMADQQNTFAAVIVAAGRGQRAGGGVPKQWRQLAGTQVATRALKAFETHPIISQIVLVVNPDDVDLVQQDGAKLVHGGASRSASVLAGLHAVDPKISHVLIHDAARPLISHEVIDRVIRALGSSDGAAPAVPVTDALWTGKNCQVTGPLNREGLYRAQTPQGFRLSSILEAHLSALSGAADDVAIARAAGIAVEIVDGDEDNLKLTVLEDFDRAERILRQKGASLDVRVGNGFDVHAFGQGDSVTLCGVEIPFERGLKGHSDADVGMHAVTDAIYGALAEGDIGQHFPPSDPQWKGAASFIFLEHAIALAETKGFAISHLDCTLICEQPKIGPYASAMRSALSQIAGIDAERISVKATTSEKLGFTGRGEGIAAQATATLVKL